MDGRPSQYVAGLPRPARALVMGVVNVTPDSFSDGGLWLEPDRAVAHGLELAAQGADLIDVGGESTRPGAARPPVEEELRRVLPVIRELAGAGCLVSVDTMRASVAERALQAGAVMVNDVSGGRADEAMLPLVAEAAVPFCCMHWRGHSATMQDHARYGDVVRDVVRELAEQVERVLAAGVAPERVAVDPGLGYAKTAGHNWALLSRLEELQALGYPVLVAASRKTFLGRLLADPDTGTPRPVHERDHASTAVAALAALAGAWCVRAHVVPPALDAVRVAARWAATAADRDASELAGSRARPASIVSGTDGGAAVRTSTSSMAGGAAPGGSGGFGPAPTEGAGVGDRITLRGIRVRGYHGVLPAERAAGQTFIVDVELGLDLAPAAVSDELVKTVDYAALAQSVADLVATRPCNLIETLADRIATRCLADVRVREVEVRVHKPEAPVGVPFDDIAVTLHRSRS